MPQSTYLPILNHRDILLIGRWIPARSVQCPYGFERSDQATLARELLCISPENKTTVLLIYKRLWKRLHTFHLHILKWLHNAKSVLTRPKNAAQRQHVFKAFAANPLLTVRTSDSGFTRFVKSPDWSNMTSSSSSIIILTGSCEDLTGLELVQDLTQICSVFNIYFTHH